jgi:hypothetical protein
VRDAKNLKLDEPPSDWSLYSGLLILADLEHLTRRAAASPVVSWAHMDNEQQYAMYSACATLRLVLPFSDEELNQLHEEHARLLSAPEQPLRHEQAETTRRWHEWLSKSHERSSGRPSDLNLLVNACDTLAQAAVRPPERSTHPV